MNGVVLHVLQFETIHGKTNHKQEKVKSLQCPYRQIGLPPKGPFMKMGNVII
jgi:hypothetical protein